MTNHKNVTWLDGGWKWRVTKPFRCPEYDKRFRHKQAVKQHVEAAHTPVVCR